MPSFLLYLVKENSCPLISGDNVEVDYRGYEVTVENLVRLLTGRLPATVPRYLHIFPPLLAVLWIRIRICRMQMFLGRPAPHPDPLVRDMDPGPDPSIVKQK
jgi:hypothetical protein